MIPWQKMILNLKGGGMSYTLIAKNVGSTPETIGHLARGEVADPRWSIGYNLLTLHHKHCRDAHEREIYAHG